VPDSIRFFGFERSGEVGQPELGSSHIRPMLTPENLARRLCELHIRCHEQNSRSIAATFTPKLSGEFDLRKKK
jgi:hypothetical protein